MIFLSTTQYLTESNIWFWFIVSCIALIAIAWFCVKLFLVLFFGGRIFRRGLWMNKSFGERDAMNIAEPPIFRQPKI